MGIKSLLGCDDVHWYDYNFTGTNFITHLLLEWFMKPTNNLRCKLSGDAMWMETGLDIFTRAHTHAHTSVGICTELLFSSRDTSWQCAYPNHPVLY